MKKFLGVLVALTMCVCLLAPVSLAADDSFAELAEILEGSGITTDDLDLESVDIDALLDELKNDASALESLVAAVDGTEASDDNEEAALIVPDAGIDLSFLTNLFAGEMDTTALTDALSGLSSVDFTSLLSTVSGAFSGAGLDLSTLDLGVDAASLLGDDLAQTTTNLTAGVMDTIKGALEAIGIDPSVIEGLLDNEIVNFFANMYIGFIGEVEESTTEKPTTTKPPVVTTKPPKTGDTSAVVVALGTLAVASAAAFVCLKKKED